MRNLLALLLLAVVVFAALKLTQSVVLPLLSGQEQWGCPALPETTTAVAAAFGGTPEQWHKAGQRSWIYDGTKEFAFRVPDGCVWHLASGVKRAGERVTFSRGATLTW